MGARQAGRRARCSGCRCSSRRPASAPAGRRPQLAARRPAADGRRPGRRGGAVAGRRRVRACGAAATGRTSTFDEPGKPVTIPARRRSTRSWRGAAGPLPRYCRHSRIWSGKPVQTPDRADLRSGRGRPTSRDFADVDPAGGTLPALVYGSLPPEIAGRHPARGRGQRDDRGGRPGRVRRQAGPPVRRAGARTSASSCPGTTGRAIRGDRRRPAAPGSRSGERIPHRSDGVGDGSRHHRLRFTRRYTQTCRCR